MSTCCAAAGKANAGALRPVRETLAWILPGAILVLMPKCPLCLAAYMALATGISLSLPVATAVRWAMLLLCIASLVFLIARTLHRLPAIFRHFHKEIEPCSTK